jgi:L-2,4-diaminobutyric acid acetyltransferase
MPDCPTDRFVWKAAVAAEARGQGLGLKMLVALLVRPRRQLFQTLQATITPSSSGSWGLFRRFHGVPGAFRSAPSLGNYVTD